jgi:hypothetical protein
MSNKTIAFSLEGGESKKSTPPKVKVGNERKRRSELLNKIKSFQKHNEINVNTNPGDFDSEFMNSLHFLDNLSKTRKKGRKHSKRQTMREPTYGCLKNGTKPTYRNISNPAPVISPVCAAPEPAPSPICDAPVPAPSPICVVPEPAPSLICVVPEPAPRPICDVPVPEPEPVPDSVPVPVLMSSPICDAPAPEPVPDSVPPPEPKSSPITKPIKKHRITKYRLGKQCDKVSVLIKNRKTRKRVEQEKTNLSQDSLQKMKAHLIERNLLKTGSNAPADVLKQIYKDSILTGDLTNKCGETLLHNFMN